MLWLKEEWAAFETWVASKLPGWKVKIISALGIMGNAVFAFQDLVSGLPLDQFLTPRSMLMFNTGLFILVWWFRRLTNRV